MDYSVKDAGEIGSLCAYLICCYCLVAQLCRLFCNHMDCSPPGSSVHRISWARGVGCHFLLQEIFPTQELNLHLLHWQVDSLPLSHLGNQSLPYTVNKIKTKLKLNGSMKTYKTF